MSLFFTLSYSAISMFLFLVKGCNIFSFMVKNNFLDNNLTTSTVITDSFNIDQYNFLSWISTAFILIRSYINR